MSPRGQARCPSQRLSSFASLTAAKELKFQNRWQRRTKPCSPAGDLPDELECGRFSFAPGRELFQPGSCLTQQTVCLIFAKMKLARGVHQHAGATSMIGQSAKPMWRTVLGVAVAVAMVSTLCGLLGAADEGQQGKEEEARREQGLRNMQRSAAQYTLSSTDTPQRAFKFHETAVIRPSNPISGTQDGALYVWTDHGRPQALLKFFTFNNITYSHAWLSLSENIFVAERGGKVVWSPAKPGIKLCELAGAPQPAETAAARLRQMRTLAAKFSATYTAVHLGAKPFELRLLTQPLLRYETDDDYRA